MAGPTNTSGTYNYSPSLGELVLYAFDNAGVRPTALTQEHMVSARHAANMIFSRWSNQGVNLWQVQLVSTPLIQGQATYTVPNNAVTVLDVYARIQQGNGPPVDRIMIPVSRSEYAAYAVKSQQGFPTVFWFDRLLSPTLTLWLVPDGTSAQFLQYYYVSQIQDANLPGGQQPEIPYRFLEAFADALAYRLARMWAPEKAQLLKAVADESYQIAAMQDEEQATQYISPMTNSYWRV